LVAGQVLNQLLPGTYQLSIRGASACELDTTFTINAPVPVVAAIGQLTNTSCGDSTGSAKITSLAGGNGGPWTMELYLDGSLFRGGAVPSDSVLRDLPFGSYELQLFDQNSCPDTVFFAIGIEQITPLVTLTADKNQICSGDTVTFTAQNPTNVPNPVYTWMLNNQILSASGSVLQLDTLKNNDQVMVILTGNPACLDPDTARSPAQTIQVLPSNLQALAQIQAIKAQACIGQAATLKALNPNNLPNPGYRWRVNGIVLPTDTNETLTLFPGQPVNTVELILFSRSTSSCISKQRDTSDVVLVTQLQAITARDSLRMQNLAAGTFLCPGTSLTFSLRSNLRGTTPLQIQWFRNDTLVASGSDTFYTASNWASGNIRIRARVLFDTSLTCISTNGGAGLDTTNTVSFTVLQPGDIRCQPCNLQLTVTPTNINCAGAGTGAISAATTGGSGGYKYSLSPNGPQNQLFPFFFNLVPGTYSVTVRDTVTGCTKTVSGINLITQNSYNVVVAAVNPTPCVAVADGKLEFVSVSDASTDLLKYKFRIRATDPYSTTRLFTGLAAGTYQMEVIDTISGCITSIARTISAPAALQAQAVVSKLPTCYGETNGKVRLDTVLNGFGIYQFSLSGDSGTFVTTGLDADVPASFGVGPVLFYIRDAQSGCLDTVSLNMSQPDSLKLAASIVIGSQCFAPTGQIKLNQFSGGTGTLSVTMKLPGANLFVPVVLPVDSVLINLIGGQYIFRITDQNNCSKDLVLDLPSNSPVAGQIQLVHPCRGTSNGQIRISNLSGGTAPYFFTLRNNQGDILAAQVDTLFDSLAAGTYSITMADASSPACEVVYTRTLNVPDPILMTIVSVTPSTCENFDGKARVIVSGGQAPYRFSIDSLPGQFTSYQTWNGDTLTITGLSTRATGSFYTLRILDNGPDGGCFEDTLFNIPGDSPLRFTYSLKNVKCFGETSGSVKIDSLNGTGPVRIQVVRAGTGEVVKVDTITGDFYLNSTFEVGGIPSGEFNLVMTQFGNCGGSKTFAFALTEPTRINIQARAYKPSADGFGLGGVLLDTVRGSVAPYTVSFNEGSFFSYKPDTLFGELEPGTYQILVRDSIGCEVSQEIEVIKDLELFIPTLFTPNGDGSNDQFAIRNLPAGSSLTVKDRWGKEVFSADPYGNDWEAKDIENGTYFWVLEMPGLGNRSGWIVIQR
jgi:gliding motility-associated-like protein